MSQYPEDEFDVAGRERAPQGTHRAPRNPWRTLLPYVLVVVLVPLLAWGAVGLLGGDDGDGTITDDTATTAPPTEPDDGDGPTGEPTEAEEPTDSEETTEPEGSEETTEPEEGLADDVIASASISVLNGAGIAGIAGEAADQLTDAGFTSVVASDYGAAAPETTTLYYRNADLAPTAEAIGDILGIDTLVELASATQNVEIAIVLRDDFA